MKQLLLLLNIFVLALGALATQSCQDSPTGYHYYDGNRYSQSGYYYRNYYNGDPYDGYYNENPYNRGYYRSNRPSIEVHL